jgi:hypothetical protein
VGEFLIPVPYVSQVYVHLDALFHIAAVGVDWIFQRNHKKPTMNVQIFNKVPESTSRQILKTSVIHLKSDHCYELIMVVKPGPFHFPCCIVIIRQFPSFCFKTNIGTTLLQGEIAVSSCCGREGKLWQTACIG